MGFEIVFCVLKSGDFFLGPVFFSVQNLRNLVTITRNLLPNITMLTYANRSEKIYVPLHFKKPLLVTGIVLTRAFIIVCFVCFYSEPDIKYLSLNLAVNRTEASRFASCISEIEKNRTA